MSEFEKQDDATSAIYCGCIIVAAFALIIGYISLMHANAKMPATLEVDGYNRLDSHDGFDGSIKY
jgi:hypothetical protein